MNKDHTTHYYFILEEIQKIDYALEDLLNLLESNKNHSTIKLQINEYYYEKIEWIKIYEQNYGPYK